MAAVLVLGGYGLIGSAIVARLRAEGVEVVVNAAGVLHRTWRTTLSLCKSRPCWL